jgi:hypothetical protein
MGLSGYVYLHLMATLDYGPLLPDIKRGDPGEFEAVRMARGLNNSTHVRRIFYNSPLEIVLAISLSMTGVAGAAGAMMATFVKFREAGKVKPGTDLYVAPSKAIRT